ncbi:hypothetical protein CPB83DRAFT_625835 [Crepidotus variabilis]|uniref:Uncharacterized protein n=1 Tax=Crepidotus variabilis TaxID=179855 RepID=A0A9P6EPC9_9AGAR|nr:hypothetical protein CPB83DRAFT_625835 [Crepidotus variabilis]
MACAYFCEQSSRVCFDFLNFFNTVIRNIRALITRNIPLRKQFRIGQIRHFSLIFLKIHYSTLAIMPTTSFTDSPYFDGAEIMGICLIFGHSITIGIWGAIFWSLLGETSSWPNNISLCD